MVYSLLKSEKKHVPKIGYKNTGCKGVHAIERPDRYFAKISLFHRDFHWNLTVTNEKVESGLIYFKI
jgi:hypothetical protein